jgi:peroxygenase
MDNPIADANAGSHKQPPLKPHHHTTTVNGTSPPKGEATEPHSTSKSLSQPTALQQHILFWDPDNDSIIHPWDVYNGFRALGFSIPFSIGSLLIPIFFSYPTSLAYSWLPDPWLRIYVDSIHKAKHGSDTGVFDVDGHFHADRFDSMFDRWDLDRVGGLSAEQMWNMWKKNRLAADVAGWCFAFMELWTTWLLLQRDGRVWKDDLMACYDGTIFWKIAEKVRKDEWKQGYGIGDFFEGILLGGTWKNWEFAGYKRSPP